ncbi:MAG: NAD(P)H-hydrate dehydratase, partial [Pseudomonadota bacterium]
PLAAVADVAPTMFRNLPTLWADRFPWPGALDDKYARGHVVIDAGPDMSGAARLATTAARRAGAGVATVACSADQTLLFQLDQPGALIEAVESVRAFETLLKTRRRNALIIGSGGGVSVRTGERTIAGLKSGLACVVDADALTVFEQDPDVLFRAFQNAPQTPSITPHEGEFARLFPDLAQAADSGADKASRARAAAARCGAVVVLKGADAVIAHPDGGVVFAGGAPPWLATAGSGDVLAGLIGGLRAQGLDAMDAACVGCWLHGAAARRCGLGLIAEDLPAAAAAALADLRRGDWSADDPFAPKAQPTAPTGDGDAQSA